MADYFRELFESLKQTAEGLIQAEALVLQQGREVRALRELDILQASEKESAMSNDDLTRRDFVSMTVAAGLAVAATGLSAQQVTETNVEIKAADGTCDAAFFHPPTGRHPGVLIWTDAFGLRPSMRELGRRLAAEGYSVLVPNPFYRVAKSPVVENASNFNFADPTQRATLAPLMGSISTGDAAERDAAAYIAWLDAQPQVDRTKKIGTQGYCMGGALVVRTAAALPARVGAGASFHGGGLVTTNPNSPHLLAPKIRARMYFGIATNDDAQQPDAKTKLKEAFDAAKVPAEVEVYAQAQHGWCVSDMPNQANGQPIYNKADAERAWSKLLALYKAGLV
jgi:carboxymethylenebutenolidase